MKKVVSLLLFICILISAVAQKRRFAAGAKIGLSSGAVSGDDLASHHLDVNVSCSNSISSIRDHLSGAQTLRNPGQQNTVLQLAFTYTFGNAKEQ